MASASRRSRWESGLDIVRLPCQSGTVMQSALLAALVFPPPAACADRLAGLDGARTRLTADGGKSFCMQRVHGDAVLFDVGVDTIE